MATTPSNPLVIFAQSDVNLPSTSQPNKRVPDSIKLTQGYDDNQIVPAEDLNFMFNLFSEHIRFTTQRITEIQTQLERERVPVGGILELTGNSANPNTILGYGTWVSFGAGEVLVGVGSHTDDRSESKTWADGDNEGEYRHVQTTAEIAQHNHGVSGTTDNAGSHSHTVPLQNTGINAANEGQVLQSGSGAPTITTSTAPDHTHAFSTTSDNTGSGSPMNNIQPSRAVYRWRRTA